MSIQLNLPRAPVKTIRLAAAAAALILTSGCATPTGALFTTASTPPDGQA